VRNQEKYWLWRAVDQDGLVLDVLVQSRRDKKAAKRLLRKLLKKQGRAPRVLVTDKLKSYAAAKREIMPGVEHRRDCPEIWGIMTIGIRPVGYVAGWGSADGMDAAFGWDGD
jgi:DDE domain